MKKSIQGAVSEKEEQIRATLHRLDEAVDSERPLSQEDISVLRRQLGDSQGLVTEQQDRLRQHREEHDVLARRRDELEVRLATLEVEYEELLDKTIHNEAQDHDHDATVAEQTTQDLKAKLETQFALKRDAAQHEMTDLRQQLELKSQENRQLAVTVDSLKGANEELKRAFAITAAGMEGGKNLAESAKDMERIRKTMATQLADFDTMKKALMKDLQDRCEKVSCQDSE